MRHTILRLVILVACFGAAWPAQATNERFSDWGPAVNLGSVVNSPSMDQTPELSNDGLSLYFSSMRLGLGSGDIWIPQRVSADAPWGPPMNLAVVNSVGNEGAPHLSRDGHYLFFSSSRDGSNDIWMSRRTHVHDDFGWEPPARLAPPVNDDSSFEGGMWFIPPEFYFASDRLNPGFALDIFVTLVRGDGTVTPPLPVAELNSAANDVRPSVRQDGREIFISSNRPGAIGNVDVWVSTRQNRADAWSLPQNLGPGINTTANDGQAVISNDGRTLLFNSDRGGNHDLYFAVRELRQQ